MYPEQPNRPAPGMPATPDEDLDLDQFEERVGRSFGIPRGLRDALKGQESGGRDSAVSPKGARGRYQVMPDTVRKYGLDPDNEFDRVYAGLKYLKEKYDSIDPKISDPVARWQGALAGYHGGEAQIKNINRTGGDIRPTSDGLTTTDKYTDSVMRKWQQLSKGGGKQHLSSPGSTSQPQGPRAPQGPQPKPTLPLDAVKRGLQASRPGAPQPAQTLTASEDFVNRFFGSVGKGFAAIPEQAAAFGDFILPYLGQEDAERIPQSTVKGPTAPYLREQVTVPAEQAIERQFPVDPAVTAGNEFFRKQLPEGAGSMAAFFAAGLAGRALGAPRAMTALYGALQNAQQAIREYDASGKNSENGRQATYAFAALVGTLEAAGLGKTIEKFGGKSKMVERLLETGEEGLQEYVSNVLNDFNAGYVGAYDPSRAKGFETLSSKENLQAGALGLILGGGGQIASAGAERLMRRPGAAAQAPGRSTAATPQGPTAPVPPGQPRPQSGKSTQVVNLANERAKLEKAARGQGTPAEKAAALQAVRDTFGGTLKGKPTADLTTSPLAPNIPEAEPGTGVEPIAPTQTRESAEALRNLRGTAEGLGLPLQPGFGPMRPETPMISPEAQANTQRSAAALRDLKAASTGLGLPEGEPTGGRPEVSAVAPTTTQRAAESLRQVRETAERRRQREQNQRPTTLPSESAGEQRPDQYAFERAEQPPLEFAERQGSQEGPQGPRGPQEVQEAPPAPTTAPTTRTRRKREPKPFDITEEEARRRFEEAQRSRGSQQPQPSSTEVQEQPSQRMRPRAPGRPGPQPTTSIEGQRIQRTMRAGAGGRPVNPLSARTEPAGPQTPQRPGPQPVGMEGRQVGRGAQPLGRQGSPLRRTSTAPPPTRPTRASEARPVPKPTPENIESMRARIDELSRMEANRRGEMDPDLRAELGQLRSAVIGYDEEVNPDIPGLRRMEKAKTDAMRERETPEFLEAGRRKFGEMENEAMREATRRPYSVEPPLERESPTEPIERPGLRGVYEEQARNLKNLSGEQLDKLISDLETTRNEAVKGEGGIDADEEAAARELAMAANEERKARVARKEMPAKAAPEQITQRTTAKILNEDVTALDDDALRKRLRDIEAIKERTKGDGEYQDSSVARRRRKYEQRVREEIAKREQTRPETTTSEAAAPKEEETTGRVIEHSTLGQVEELRNQRGVPRGYLRVRQRPSLKTSIIKNPRTSGNRSAAFVKSEAKSEVEQKPAETPSSQFVTPDLNPAWVDFIIKDIIAEYEKGQNNLPYIVSQKLDSAPLLAAQDRQTIGRMAREEVERQRAEESAQRAQQPKSRGSDETVRLLEEASRTLGQQNKGFREAATKTKAKETDVERLIVKKLNLDKAPLSLGFVSNPLIYSESLRRINRIEMAALIRGVAAGRLKVEQVYERGKADYVLSRVEKSAAEPKAKKTKPAKEAKPAGPKAPTAKGPKAPTPTAPQKPQITIPRQPLEVTYTEESSKKYGSGYHVSLVKMGDEAIEIQRDPGKMTEFRDWKTKTPIEGASKLDMSLSRARMYAETLLNRRVQAGTTNYKGEPIPDYGKPKQQIVRPEPDEFKRLAEKSATEKSGPTGFTKTQAAWLGGAIKESMPELGQTGTSVRFEVPGDGQFTVETPRQANRLYKQATGEYIEGAPRPDFKEVEEVAEQKRAKGWSDGEEKQIADKANELRGNQEAIDQFKEKTRELEVNLKTGEIEADKVDGKKLELKARKEVLKRVVAAEKEAKPTRAKRASKQAATAEKPMIPVGSPESLQAGDLKAGDPVEWNEGRMTVKGTVQGGRGDRVIVRDDAGQEYPIDRARLRRPGGAATAQQKPDFVKEAEDRLERGRGDVMGAGGPSAQEIVDMTVVSGWKLYREGIKFRDWARSVIAEIGQRVRPYLQATWKRLQDALQLATPEERAERLRQTIEQNRQAHEIGNDESPFRSQLKRQPGQEIDIDKGRMPEPLRRGWINREKRDQATARREMTTERNQPLRQDVAREEGQGTRLKGYAAPGEAGIDVSRIPPNLRKGFLKQQERARGAERAEALKQNQATRATNEDAAYIAPSNTSTDVSRMPESLKRGWVNRARRDAAAGNIAQTIKQNRETRQKTAKEEGIGSRLIGYAAEGQAGSDVSRIPPNLRKGFMTQQKKTRALERQEVLEQNRAAREKGADQSGRTRVAGYAAEGEAAHVVPKNMPANLRKGWIERAKREAMAEWDTTAEPPERPSASSVRTVGEVSQTSETAEEMYKNRPRWDIPRATKAPTNVQEVRKLISDARTEYHPETEGGQGVLWVNHQASVVVASALRQIGRPINIADHQFYGLSVDLQDAQAAADFLSKAGRDPQLIEIGNDLAYAVDQAFNAGRDSVVIADSTISPKAVGETVTEEFFHGWQRGSSLMTLKAVDEVHYRFENNPTYKKIADQLKEYPYGYTNDAATMSVEVPAKLASGQAEHFGISDDEAYDFLHSYYSFIYRKFGTGALLGDVAATEPGRRALEDVRETAGIGRPTRLDESTANRPLNIGQTGRAGAGPPSAASVDRGSQGRGAGRSQAPNGGAGRSEQAGVDYGKFFGNVGGANASRTATGASQTGKAGQSAQTQKTATTTQGAKGKTVKPLQTAAEYFQEQLDADPLNEKTAPRNRQIIADARAELKRAADRFSKGKISDDQKEQIVSAADDLMTAAHLGDRAEIVRARRELAKAVRGGSVLRTIGHYAAEPFKTTRTLTYGSDLSYAFRQALPLTVYPKNWMDSLRAGREMMRALVSADKTQQIKEWMQEHPAFDLAEKSGLEFGMFGEGEEIYDKDWATRVPWIRNTERANQVYLDYMRLTSFAKMVKGIQDNPNLSPKQQATQMEAMAEVINTLTGRTSLGEGRMRSAIQGLQGVMTAPRLNYSRIQMLNPAKYIELHKQSPAAARQMLYQTGFAVSSMAALGLLAAAAGVGTFSTDPDDPDFGKLVIGNTRYDLFGGLLPVAKVFWDLGEVPVNLVRTAITNDKTTRRELSESRQALGKRIESFTRGRLTPAAAFTYDLFYKGKNMAGQPVTPAELIKLSRNNPALRLYTPALLNEMIDGYQDAGLTGLVKSSPSFVGIGASTYNPEERAGYLDRKSPFLKAAADLGVRFKSVRRDPDDSDQTYKVRTDRVQRWLDQYGPRLLNHSGFKRLDAEDKREALESLRARVGGQSKMRSPETDGFDAETIVEAVRAGKERKKERKADTIFAR